MNDCSQVNGFLLLAADEELEPEQSAWLEAHLEGCEACRLNRSRILEMDRDLAVYREQLFRPHRSRTRRWIAPVAGVLAASAMAAAILFREPTTLAKPRLDDGAFVAIPYTVPLAPYERAAVLRTELSVAALIAAGFDIRPTDTAATLNVEVLVGQDGRARAIRLLPN
ncbi:MAG TPA: zf-HC2 domain-containing protein [Candidatus Acidoferrales bacterium]|jgi:predicted anti-sigma-YlaC factor YlaD|nr:zf-HC2 domain-containing protein [Candidatus Acidoferrales bacterium]